MNCVARVIPRGGAYVPARPEGGGCAPLRTVNPSEQRSPVLGRSTTVVWYGKRDNVFRSCRIRRRGQDGVNAGAVAFSNWRPETAKNKQTGLCDPGYGGRRGGIYGFSGGRWWLGSWRPAPIHHGQDLPEHQDPRLQPAEGSDSIGSPEQFLDGVSWPTRGSALLGRQGRQATIRLRGNDDVRTPVWGVDGGWKAVLRLAALRDRLSEFLQYGAVP